MTPSPPSPPPAACAANPTTTTPTPTPTPTGGSPASIDAIADDGLLRPALLAAAAARIGGILPATPLVRSERLGAWLKLECLQITGAYKVRGALNALAARVARGDRRAVFAASAGNHGLGVAWSARHLGIAATIVVPDAAPENKVAGCRALGARVGVRPPERSPQAVARRLTSAVRSRRSAGRRRSQRAGPTLIPPRDAAPSTGRA